jgi:ribonuclease HI
MAEETFTLEFDGGSRGNPGPAALGVVVRAADGTPLVTLGRYLGIATNNVAEYRALVTGLAKARELGAKRLRVRGDSELVIKQMKGEYRVKHPDLRPLYQQAQELAAQFDELVIEHNYRDKNTLADRLVNLALDRKREVTEAQEEGAPAEVDAPSPQETKAGAIFACVRCGCSIEVRNPSRIRPHQLRPFVCQCGQKMVSADELPRRG